MVLALLALHQNCAMTKELGRVHYMYQQNFEKLHKISSTMHLSYLTRSGTSLDNSMHVLGLVKSSNYMAAKISLIINQKRNR